MPHKNPTTPGRTAHAPYNFIPLPGRVIPTTEPVPPQDRFHEERLTGRITVSFVTKSPLYVRAGISNERGPNNEASDFERLGQERGQNLPYRDALRNRPDFFSMDREAPTPVIPGRSLRGMLRALMKIAAFGKLAPLDPKPVPYYRAVAGQPPLKDRYKSALEGIQAGYLKKAVKEGKENWSVVPAETVFREAYWTVNDRDLNGCRNDLVMEPRRTGGESSGEDSHRELRPLSEKSPPYRPGYANVKYAPAPGHSGRGGPRNVLRDLSVLPATLGEALPRGWTEGTLVCSGNMQETGEAGSGGQRYNHALIGKRAKASEIPIEGQAVTDYRNALTPYLRENYGRDGILIDGAPVFFVALPSGEEGKRVVRDFGHCQNFRVPYRRVDAEVSSVNGDNGDNGHKTVQSAVRFSDFAPDEHRDDEIVDFAEAIFGYVRFAPDEGSQRTQGTHHRSCAGRIEVSDARWMRAAPRQPVSTVWLNDGVSLTPRILSSPKPECFAMYLEQDQPDVAETLRHYGSADTDTRLRGFKRYWLQEPHPGGWVPHLQERTAAPPNSTQHTTLRPVREGVRFQFEIRFENLSPIELGALLWTLRPGSDPSPVYWHQMGMGKPLGMGAIEIAVPIVRLTARRERYKTLFSKTPGGWAWTAGESLANRTEIAAWRTAFTAHLCNLVCPDAETKNLSEVPRIAMLLRMMNSQMRRPAFGAGGTAGDDTAGGGDSAAYMAVDSVLSKEKAVLPEP